MVDLDPRVVILGFLSTAIWITGTSGIWVAMLWLGGLLALGAILRKRRGGMLPDLRRLRWAVPLGIVVVLLYLLFARDFSKPYFGFDTWDRATAGLPTGFHLAVRLVAFVILAGLLTDLASPSGLAAGITRLLLPMRRLGVRVETVYHLVLFTTRMVPLLTEELKTIRMGQLSRGVRFEGSLKKRIAASASIIVPAFASAVRRSERLSLALATRGFDPDKVPISVTELRLTATDIGILSAAAIGWIVYLAPMILGPIG